MARSSADSQYSRQYKAELPLKLSNMFRKMRESFTAKTRKAQGAKSASQNAADILRGLASKLSPSLRREAKRQYDIELTAASLRRNPTEFMPIIEQILSNGSAVDRQTIAYPYLSQYGIGGSGVMRRDKNGNLARNISGLSLPKLTPYNLRRFSEIPPARRAITNITQPILDQQWIICPEDDDISIADDSIDLTTKVRIMIATNNLLHPNNGESWRVFLSRILEDIVVGGFGAAEIRRTFYPFKPFNFFSTDGQSLNINSLWNGDPDDIRYEQVIGYNNSSITQLNSFPSVKLSDEELMYCMLNPRSNTPFGFGYIETAYMLINAWIGAFSFAEKKASNAIPNKMIFLGEGIDPSYVEIFRHYWRNEIEGQGETPIIGGGKAPSTLDLGQSGEDQLWIKWQEFLIRLIAIATNQSPMSLGLERDVNRSTAESSTQKDWQIVEPVAQIIADHITHDILRKNFGNIHFRYRGLKFKWIIKNPDEKRHAETLMIQWSMNAVTVNELRKIYMRPPLPEPQGSMTKTAFEAYAYSWSQSGTGNPQQGQQNMEKNKSLALPLS